MKISTNPANPNEFHYALVYPIPSTGGKGYSYAVVAVISRDAYANRLPDSFKNLKARTVTPSGVGSKVSNSVITVDTPITPEESAANFIMTDTQDNPSNALKVKYKPYEVGGKNESKLTESKYNSILNHIRKAGFTVKESEIEIRVLNDRTEKELYKKYPGISMQLAKGMPYLIIPTDQAPSTPIIIRLSPKKISKKNFKSELEILTKYIETVEQFQELTKDLAAKGLITKPLMLGGNRSFAAMISAMSNIYQNIRPDENGNIRSLGQDITLDKITKAHPFYGQLYSFIMDAANNKANTTPEGVKIFDQSIFEQYEPMFKLAYEMDSMVHGERVKRRNLRGPAQKIFDKIAKSNLVWFPNDSTQDVVILRNERTIYVGKNKKEITGARSLLGAADPTKEAIMLTGKVANSIRRKIAQRFTKVFGRELTPEDQAVIDNLDIPKSLPTNDGLIRTVFTTEELRAILNLDDKGESNVNNGFGLRVPIQTSMVNNKKMPGKGGAINPEIEIALEEHFETNFETILPTKMSIFMQPNSDFGMEPFPTAPESPIPPADTPPAPVSNDPSTIGSLLDPDTHISDYEPTSENINNYSEATAAPPESAPPIMYMIPMDISDRFIPTQPTIPASTVEVMDRYSDADVKSNPDKVFVFGDNVQRKGTKGQAQIRNNNNAMGIATKLAPSTDSSAYMSDKDFDNNKSIIDRDINKIKATGKTVVFPKDGLGTGLAKLKEKAPKTYSYLKQRLLEEFGFDNDTGKVSAPLTQPTPAPTPTQQPVVETPPAPAAPVRPKPTNPSMEVVLAYTSGGANIISDLKDLTVGFSDLRSQGGHDIQLQSVGERAVSYSITTTKNSYNIFKIVPIRDVDRGGNGYYAVGVQIPHGQKLDPDLIIQMLDEMFEVAIDNNLIKISNNETKKGYRAFHTNLEIRGQTPGFEKTYPLRSVGIDAFKSVTNKYMDKLYVDTSDTVPTSVETDSDKRKDISGYVAYQDTNQLYHILSNLQDPIFKNGKFVSLVSQDVLNEFPQWNYYDYARKNITSQMNLPAVVPNAVPPVSSATQQLTIEDILEQAANNYIAMKKSKSRFFNANLAAETLNNSKFKSQVKRKFIDLNYNPSTPESTLIEQVIKPIYETFHC